MFRLPNQITAILLILLLSGPVLACPTCKQSIEETDAQAAGLSAGFAYSIVLMLGTPPLILASLGTMFYLQVQRHRKELEAAATEAPTAGE